MVNSTHPLVALLALALASCLPAADDLPIQTSQQTVSTTNRISCNALGTAEIVSGALSSSALASSVLSSKDFELNTEATDGLELTEEGRELLRYITMCALEEDETLQFTVDSVPYELSGLLGVASSWTQEPLSTSQAQAMSACLLAHVNMHEVSVHISVRRHGIADVTLDEAQRYNRYEGTFFGSVFSPTQHLYACSGDPAPDFSVPYPTHDITQGDRLLRRCTDPSSIDPGETECRFTYVGQCSDVCATSNGGSHSDCTVLEDMVPVTYAETMSVWLLAYHDAESVWADHYDHIFGSAPDPLSGGSCMN